MKKNISKTILLITILLPSLSFSNLDLDNDHNIQSETRITKPKNFEKSHTKYSDDYYTFYINNNYKVQNNVWGYYAGSYTPKYYQCVFNDKFNTSLFGWEWKLDSATPYPSYPRIGYGWNPWDKKSTTPNLPRKLNSLNSIQISFDKKFISNGIYNTSFDIWITDKSKPQKENISAEIMIWIDTKKIPDTELTIDNLLIDNNKYSFYKNTRWYHFPMFIFLKKTNNDEKRLDIMPFLKYLFKNKHVSSENYLADIEFGNEIWSGSGIMEINNYKIEIK